MLYTHTPHTAIRFRYHRHYPTLHIHRHTPQIYIMQPYIHHTSIYHIDHAMLHTYIHQTHITNAISCHTLHTHKDINCTHHPHTLTFVQGTTQTTCIRHRCTHGHTDTHISHTDIGHAHRHRHTHSLADLESVSSHRLCLQCTPSLVVGRPGAAALTVEDKLC